MISRPIRNFLVTATIVALFAGASSAKTPASSKTTTHSKTSAKTVHGKTSKRRRHARKGAWKHHGQQKIDAARATQIQEALIREKYLEGSPSGVWDSRTETAMQRYQAANGWQSKVTPDSRALIKLGLGPNHESDLINLDTSKTSDSVASTNSNASTTAKRQ
jgi:peptidoglycan hydrolase-like protein with peptidoglycan-binding domain